MSLTPETAARKDRTQPSGNEMQHRHFATIAAIIRDMDFVHTGTQGFVDIREDVATHFANGLARTNPRFDRKRFLAACKP